jgi:hypothetical protein
MVAGYVRDGRGISSGVLLGPDSLGGGGGKDGDRPA